MLLFPKYSFETFKAVRLIYCVFSFLIYHAIFGSARNYSGNYVFHFKIQYLKKLQLCLICFKYKFQKFEEDMKYVNSKLKNIDTKLSSIHPTNNAYVSKLKGKLNTF